MASLVIGSCSLLVSLIVLTLTVLSFMRTRERLDFDWEVHPLPELGRGIFGVRTSGQDTAHKSRIEMWDGHDHVVEERKTLTPNEVVHVALPHRQKHGPDPVDLPPRVALPPSSDSVIQQMQAATEAMDRKLRADAESQQVYVRILWRTRRGSWHTHEEQTG